MINKVREIKKRNNDINKSIIQDLYLSLTPLDNDISFGIRRLG